MAIVISNSGLEDYFREFDSDKQPGDNSDEKWEFVHKFRYQYSLSPYDEKERYSLLLNAFVSIHGHAHTHQNKLSLPEMQH